MAHVIVTEKLYNAAFVAGRTEGFDEYAAGLAGKTPEWAEAITGVPADDIRRAARIYAGAKAAAMYWGMGISQSTHGTDNTLTLTNLALLCGHIGRPGTGLNPLRGQNNVQGCSDVGGVPSFYTAYQPVDRSRRARRVRGGLGRAAACRAGPDHHRDGGRHPDGRGQGLVRDGREPADERAEPGARPPRRRAAGVLRRPGHLLQRDQRLRRRDPARGQLRREGRHLHQLRPPRPARAPGSSAARPGPRRLGDRGGSGAADDRADDGRRTTRRTGRRSSVVASSNWTYPDPSAIWDEMRPRDARLRRHHLRRGWSGRAASTGPARRRSIPARPTSSPTTSRAAAASSGRWTPARPASCRTPTIRSCSAPAACSTTGTAAR